MGSDEAYLGAVNAFEVDMRARTDGELSALTDVFRKRLGDGESLDDLLAEGFATVREAARRTLFQRHHDAQVMAGVAEHFGNIAEVPAGEGKTLAVTLPAYLNALAGGGVHVVTANDHLARRELRKALARLYPISAAVSDFVGNSGGLPAQLICDRVQADAHAAYSRREQELTSSVMRDLEQQVLLNVIDLQWREHLTRASVLRDKIWRGDLDAATQLAEYRRQSRELLDRTITEVKQEAVSYLFNLDVEATQAAQDTNDHQ